MNDKIKNIITNILGLLFFVLSLHAYFYDKSLTIIVSLVLIGLALFLFKNSTLISIVKKVILFRNGNK